MAVWLDTNHNMNLGYKYIQLQLVLAEVWKSIHFCPVLLRTNFNKKLQNLQIQRKSMKFNKQSRALF